MPQSSLTSQHTTTNQHQNTTTNQHASQTNAHTTTDQNTLPTNQNTQTTTQCTLTNTTTTNLLTSSSSLPACIEIPISNNARKFGMASSSEINKRQLVDPDIIVAKYEKYHTESKVSILAQRLAQKSYFGDDLLGRCTVCGSEDYVALPIVELNQLKKRVFQIFPKYWLNPLKFEEIWTACSTSIGRRYKRMRKS